MIASADGCRGGWLLVKSSSWPCILPPFAGICADFGSVLEFTRECSHVFVDIPIGLPSGDKIRECDMEARALLGSKGSSRVFLTPPRECLHATCPEDFQKLHREARKKGAGLPVWGILDKINEVDRLMTPELQGRIFEFHPELAWQRSAGRALDSKHGEVGLCQRKELLNALVPNLDVLVSWTRKLGSAARIDDLFDSLIGLSVAECARSNKAARLPSKAEADIRGLSMEIWY